MMVDWQNITRFIRCLSRTSLEPTDIAAIHRRLMHDVAWDHVATLAEMEGVTGLLYYHLNKLNVSNHIPEDVFQLLQSRYSRIKQHTLDILKETETLSLVLEKNGIQVAALQGLSLINTIYNDPGWRPLGDVDLMVKQEHKQPLKKCLYKSGYMPAHPAYPDLLLKNDIWIDIHTHLLNVERIHARRYLFPQDLSAMWERAIPFFRQSNGLLRLDPYDNIIALAAHALKHNYSRLIWLVDLHESILKWTNNRLGWENITEKTKFWQQKKIVLYALLVLEAFFDLNIPVWIKQELGIDRLAAIEKYLIRLRIKGFSSTLLCHLLLLMNIQSLAAKLAFVKETIFPKNAIMVQLFDGKSPTGRRSIYTKRLAQAVGIMSDDLIRALSFFSKEKG